MVHHEEDAGLLALDEAACEAVGNASARGPCAGIQVFILSVNHFTDAGACCPLFVLSHSASLCWSPC